jgi:hypothetical protein
VDSGDYDRALSEVAREARAWIRTRAEQAKPGEQLAVVFDIDETVLSNLPHMREMDFGYVADEWNAWVARGEAPALTAMRDVYDEAVARRLRSCSSPGVLIPGTEPARRAICRRKAWAGMRS